MRLAHLLTKLRRPAHFAATISAERLSLMMLNELWQIRAAAKDTGLSELQKLIDNEIATRIARAETAGAINEQIDQATRLREMVVQNG